MRETPRLAEGPEFEDRMAEGPELVEGLEVEGLVTGLGTTGVITVVTGVVIVEAKVVNV